MPRVNYLGTVPEVDKIKALILERQNALGYTQSEMANVAGFSLTKWREMVKSKPTTQWELGTILKLSKALGIPKDTIRAAI